MTDFFLKRGDRLPLLRRTLKTSDGVVIDLTGATVRFLYRIADDTLPAVIGAGPVALIDATNGIVEYSWSAADGLLAVGRYKGEFEAILAGLRLTAPGNGYLEFRVTQDLGDGALP